MRSGLHPRHLKHREYPKYDKAKAFSPAFVEYINELLTEVPEDEKALFDRWAPLGMMSEEEPGEMEEKEIQAGIDSAYIAIQEESKNLEIGNGYIAATEVFGTREFLMEIIWQEPRGLILDYGVIPKKKLIIFYYIQRGKVRFDSRKMSFLPYLILASGRLQFMTKM